MKKDYAQKLSELKEELATLKEQRMTIIKTGQSWSLRNGEDQRSLTNVSLVQINALIADRERQVEELEGIVENGRPSRGLSIRARVI